VPPTFRTAAPFDSVRRVGKQEARRIVEPLPNELAEKDFVSLRIGSVLELRERFEIRPSPRLRTF
jgi:hypothetical protein